jgi:hypothetical protein
MSAIALGRRLLMVGRFANASGTFTVVQTRGLSMPYFNSATIDGTIDLGH